MAGRESAELNVAGPHAAQRQVIFGVRAGGSLEAHAARGPALAASRWAKARRTELTGHSSRPNRSVFAAELVGDGRRVFVSRRLGPLVVVIAPLVARRRLRGRRRCAFGLAAGTA